MSTQRTIGWCGGFVLALSVALVSGCSNQSTLFPNPDQGLRKKPTEFAADAAKRHPYKAEAPRGGEAVARAEVNYGLDMINVINLSDEDWSDAEVWVNQQYVVFVPSMPRNLQRTINFQIMFNDAGQSLPLTFPLSKAKVRVTKIEVLRNGTMYDVPVHLAD